MRADQHTYSQLQNFNQAEFEDPFLMSRSLLLKTDYFRSYIDTPVIVSSSTGGNHTEGSDHYKGDALDIICPFWKGGIVQLYLEAERFNFGAVGVYPHWRYNGKIVGGLHIAEPDPSKKVGARWMGISKATGLNDNYFNEYIALNSFNLFKYGGSE